MASGNITVSVIGIEFFRNSLSSTQTVNGSGSSNYVADQAAAKLNAKNAALNSAYSKSASYSPVRSGYGSSNNNTGDIIGVGYSRWNNKDASATITGTTSTYDEYEGVRYWRATATASGTATARRYTYSAVLTVNFNSAMTITDPNTVTNAEISLTPTNINGGINNYTWQLAVKKSEGTFSSFVHSLSTSNYDIKEIKFSSTNSEANTYDITSLVKTMVSTGNRQIYLICKDIPSDDTNFTLTTANVSFPTGITYTQSKVLTNTTFGLKATELQSQNYIATPGQPVTLTWGEASGGLGTTVKGFELSYVENGKTVIVNNNIPNTQFSITYPASSNRGYTRQFRIRALAEQTAPDLQGDYVLLSITTNTLPTAPDFRIIPAEGSVYGEKIEEEPLVYLKKRYWFKSDEGSPYYTLDLNITLSTDTDKSQTLTYEYYKDGIQVSFPIESMEATVEETVYEIRVFDGLEYGPSTIVSVQKNIPMTLEVPAASDDSAPFKDAKGNPYWIYFNGEANASGGHGLDYQYSWKLNGTEIKTGKTIIDFLLLTSNIPETIPLEVTVTDGVDSAIFTYNFKRPAPAAFRTLNQNNHEMPNIENVNELYFGNFLGFETTDLNRDEGVKITLNTSSFIKKETQGGFKYWALLDYNINNLSRNQLHIFNIVQTWGEYTVNLSFERYRTLDYKDFLSGLSLYKDDDGSVQTFYPLPHSNISIPQSYGIIDGTGLPAPIGYIDSVNLAFGSLSGNIDFAARSAISTDIDEVFKVEIWQKDQSTLQTLVLQGGETGARLEFNSPSGNQEIQIITWDNKNLVNWQNYFSITDNRSIDAIMKISIINLFGEIFSTTREFKINFSALLKQSIYEDVGILLTDGTYSSIKELSEFSVFEDETFKFDFSAISYYSQNIIAHVSFAGQEQSVILSEIQQSFEDYSTSYRGSVIFNVPPILSQTMGAPPQIWLTAPGLDEEVSFYPNTVFNLRRANIAASDLVISDILAEKLNEIDSAFQGEEYLNAYRYTVSLKGTDFGGENSYEFFAGNPIYSIYFSPTSSFENGQKIIDVAYSSYPNLSFIFKTNYSGAALDEKDGTVVGPIEGNQLLGLTKDLRQGYIKIDYQFENDFEKDNSFKKNSISGNRFYSKTLGIMAVFALKPTVYYGANRLGLNTSILNFQDSILEVCNKDDTKNRIYFTNVSSNQEQNSLMVDLKTGESYGFIFLGTSWDNDNNSNYMPPTSAEGREF